MASPRFMFNNLIDSATLTASSEDSVLVGANIANALRTKVWQTGTASAAETMVIDHGSAKAVTCIVLLDHDLTNADSLIKIEFNATDSWGSPSASETLTWSASPIVKYFSSQSYRYNRITFTKSASNETRQIGRVFVGTYFESPVAENINFNTIDLSKSTTTIGGQNYSDVRNNYDELSIPMALITKADMDTLKPEFASVGTHTPYFFAINNDVEANDWVYYVKNKKIPGFSAVSSTNYWSTSLSLREML